MLRRKLSVLLLLGAFLSLGATYRTTNFVVTAATPQLAEQVGKYAEHYRKQKALEWLGTEMPQWGVPCPIRVTVTMGGSGGATSFGFDNGQILSQDMHIEGTVERLLASVLPHEVTHTVFAYHFRQPVPRWADEGGSVLSEDIVERQRHDKLVRNILNNRRAMPLRRLFSLREYPPDVMVLYAQGFSVADFLVSKSSKPALLNFVADAMRGGWDQAARTHFGYQSIEEMEQAWLQHLRNSKQQPQEVASRNVQPSVAGSPGPQVVVRLSVPAPQPLEATPSPVYRGVAGGPEEQPMTPFRPTGLGIPAEQEIPPPPPPVTLGPPVVRLGPPEFPPYQPAQAPIVPGAGYPE
jgi:hypothetical protein